MLACVDVDYRPDEAVAACVLFHGWSDEEVAAEHVQRVPEVAPYQPGQFYKRELPCLLAVLGLVSAPLEAIVIDGYVWLGQGRPGLGARLHEALGGRIPIIGVAKTRFASARAVEVVRACTRPLYVTAAGIDAATAAGHIQTMHGPYRIPTLLKRVDALCRAS
jgi:deoxyribonuclease V